MRHRHKAGFGDRRDFVFYAKWFVIWALIYTGLYIILNFLLNEIFGRYDFFKIKIVYILLIGLASLIPGNGVFRGAISGGLWVMWLFDNVLFILVILSVIGYGTRYRSAEIVNLAIMFFALDIITRYIGFVLDFGGQMGFAVMSILGGIILIAGGWGIEKWRRKLIEKTKEKSQQGYAIY